MEYTRSIGEAYEFFEGKPDEIAMLIHAIDKKPKKSFFDNMKIAKPTIPIFPINPVGIYNATPVRESGSLKGGER